MLTGLLFMTALVSAGTNSWSAETIPSTTNNVLGPSGIDVCDIAVANDSTTIYSVPGDSISTKTVYKSTDAGISWTGKNISVTADLVAVAPDDADIVAIAASGTAQVYLTINGGANWRSLGIPQESGSVAAAAIALYDIAISAASNGVNYVAVAGKEAGDIANVWYYNAGAVVPVWKGTNAFTGFSSSSEVAAVAFSPSFTLDKAMVAVTEKGGDSVMLQIFNFDTSGWNDNSGFTGYPITIVCGSGITGLSSASLSLDPEYLAYEDDLHNIFIGLTITGDATAVTSSGIYRLSSDQKTILNTGAKIHSVAFDGSKLVAGSYDTTNVYRSADPLAEIPSISPVATLKGPGGTNKVMVAWADSNVVAGTSGVESALAVSRDNGEAFNDISLIDTAITHVRDVAVTEDGNRVYLITDDGLDLSLWRKDSIWERILSRQGTSDYIIRLAPEDEDVLYIAKKGGTAIYQSKNGGEAEWSSRICNLNVQDMAVADDDTAYALNESGSVSKTIDASLTWGTTIPTTLSSGATIVCAGTSSLLVGSQDGYVAYSTDGNSWAMIPAMLASGAGKVQVTADEGFTTNKIIYAASDTAGQPINKWQIGVSTTWTNISYNIPCGIYGLVMNGDTLYTLEFNNSTKQSTLRYLLLPTTATVASSSWSTITTTTKTDADNPEVWLNTTPRALKVSSDKLWAVKTNGISKLYSFTHVLPEGSLLSPAPGFINHVNAKTGFAYNIAFSWKRPGEASAYEFQIAFDKTFYSLLATITIASEEPTVTVVVGPRQTGYTMVNFTPGTSYCWRMRAIQPSYGRYSEVRSFSIEPVLAVVPELLSPANGRSGVSRQPGFSWSPFSGVLEYQFVLGDDVTLTSPIIDTTVKTTAFAVNEELEYGQTYFWKVRAVKPAATGWSAIANFTVVAKPTDPAPPVIITQISPPVIEQPVTLTTTIIFTPPPKMIISIPPPSSPKIVIADYLYAGLITASVLLVTVIALIVKTFSSWR